MIWKRMYALVTLHSSPNTVQISIPWSRVTVISMSPAGEGHFNINNMTTLIGTTQHANVLPSLKLDAGPCWKWPRHRKYNTFYCMISRVKAFHWDYYATLIGKGNRQPGGSRWYRRLVTVGKTRCRSTVRSCFISFHCPVALLLRRPFVLPSTGFFLSRARELSFYPRRFGSSVVARFRRRTFPSLDVSVSGR